MPDFASAEETTWHPLADQFTSIKIDGNITHIGKNAFAECVNVSSLTLACKGTKNNAVSKYVESGMFTLSVVASNTHMIEK